MCQICEKAKPGLAWGQKQEILDEYSQFLLRGDDCPTIDDAIGVLLEATMEERDRYVEAHWEEEQRNRDEK